VVRDLEIAKRTWNRLGFTTTPRGRHIGRGSGNYCVMLTEGYIELIGVVDPSLPTSSVAHHLQFGQGLVGLAFGTDDPDRAAKDMTQAGLRPIGPAALERKLELDGGDAVMRFRVANAADDAVPGFRAFVCQHLSPELVRRREWIEHANGAVMTVGYTIAATDPAPVLDVFARLFGADRVSAAAIGHLVDTGRERIAVVPRDRIGEILPGLSPRSERPLPSIVATTIKVRDLRRAKACLDSTGVDPRPGPEGSWLVPAEEATGAVVVLTG
jgi:hypothetical protein